MQSQVMIICIVDRKKLHQLLLSRDSHLQYIAKNQDKISYAGIVETTEETYQQIIYFLNVNFEMAQTFIQNDPYFDSFQEIKFLPFTQKIPRNL